MSSHSGNAVLPINCSWCNIRSSLIALCALEAVTQFADPEDVIEIILYVSLDGFPLLTITHKDDNGMANTTTLKGRKEDENAPPVWEQYSNNGSAVAVSSAY